MIKFIKGFWFAIKVIYFIVSLVCTLGFLGIGFSGIDMEEFRDRMGNGFDELFGC